MQIEDNNDDYYRTDLEGGEGGEEAEAPAEGAEAPVEAAMDGDMETAEGRDDDYKAEEEVERKI